MVSRRSILALAVGVICASNAAAEGGHAHHHHHGSVELSNAATAPAVAVRVEADAMSGWNLQVLTENFRFAPEKVNRSNTPGEGHAHVYVNGKKLARLYGPWLHLTDLGPGPHEVRVSLNANDHSEYRLNGEAISATTTVGH